MRARGKGKKNRAISKKKRPEGGKRGGEPGSLVREEKSTKTEESSKGRIIGKRRGKEGGNTDVVWDSLGERLLSSIS